LSFKQGDTFESDADKNKLQKEDQRAKYTYPKMVKKFKGK
jgi:hypothetical protein